MSLSNLNVVNSAPEKDLFSYSFDGALPLPPPGGAYYVQSQDQSINYVDSEGNYYERSI